MTYQMPVLNFAEIEKVLDSRELKLARMIVASQGKNEGCLRASKPPTPKMKEYNKNGKRYFDYKTAADAQKGMAAFVWRHVVFAVSTNPQHQCTPVTASFYLPYREDREARRQLENWLMDVADRIVKTVPVTEHHGTFAWGKALGYF